MPAIVPYTPENRVRPSRYSPYQIYSAVADRFRGPYRAAADRFDRAFGLDRGQQFEVAGAPLRVAKRRLDMSSGGVGRMGQFVAGATNVVQRGYKKLKSGRKPKSNAKLALKFIKSTQASAIIRYQRISPYETPINPVNAFTGPGSLPLCQIPITLPGGEQFELLPVYLFDLTSSHYADSDNNFLNGLCQYQLAKYSAGGLVGPVGAYDWIKHNGQAADGTATADHWVTERNQFNQNGDGGFYRAGGTQYLDWADIRLTLFGARAQTTRYTVSLIQFNDRSYDTEMRRNQSVPVDNMRSAEEQANYDSAWDEFVQPLVYHPMHSAGATKIKLFKTLMKRSYVIAPDTVQNVDANQPNVCVKLFKRFNRMLNYGWDDEALGLNGLAMDNAVFKQRYAGQNRPYVHPRAKVFLMVTAQAFNRVSSLDAININNTPVFDVVIRKKHVFDKA